MYFFLFSKSKFDVSPVWISKSWIGWTRADLILFDWKKQSYIEMHTWKHWTGNCLTKRLSVPLPNVCQCVFPVSSHLQTLTLAVKDSGNHITAVSYFLALSSIRPVSLSPEGRGESLSVCDIVFPQSSSAFPSARVCPCAAHWLSCQMRRGFFFFFFFQFGLADVLMCPSSMQWRRSP